jgi:hypothetical protein
MNTSCSRVLQLALAAGFFASQDAHAQSFVEQSKLTAPGSRVLDELSGDLALDGDTLAVGAVRASVPGLVQSGAVFVYTRSGSSWTPSATVTPSAPVDFSFFGETVELDGDDLVVGAPFEDRVYAFRRVAGVWTQQAVLAPPPVNQQVAFGASLALEGDTLAVGAPQHNSSSGDDSVGRVFVFRRTGGVWGAPQIVEGSGNLYGGFGRNLALSGAHMVVTEGSPFSQGAAIYAFNGTDWQFQQNAPVSATAASWGSGVRAVAIDGSTLAIAVPQWNALFVPAPVGRVFVSELVNGVWTLAADFPGAGDVRVSGEYVVAGDVRDATAGVDAGAVKVARKRTTAWDEFTLGLASDAAPGDLLGVRVDIDGTTLAAAAGNKQVATSVIAPVYVGVNLGSAVAYCTGKINSLGCTPSISAVGATASASGSGAFTLRADQLIGSTSGLAFYSLSGRAAVPFQGGFLCVEAPLRRTPLTTSSPSAPGVCGGVSTVNFNSVIASGTNPALNEVGALVRAQWWHRDAAAPIPTSLTDALEFSVGP